MYYFTNYRAPGLKNQHSYFQFYDTVLESTINNHEILVCIIIFSQVKITNTQTPLNAEFGQISQKVQMHILPFP